MFRKQRDKKESETVVPVSQSDTSQLDLPQASTSISSSVPELDDTSTQDSHEPHIEVALSAFFYHFVFIVS